MSMREHSPTGGPIRDSWAVRSNQAWKLRAAEVVLIGGAGLGLYMFFLARWPASFYGALITMAATPLSYLIAAFVRCPACGFRVALGAPPGGWSAYTLPIKACPVCGDDGEARGGATNGLSVWQQAARTLAAKDRSRRRMRVSPFLVAAVFAAIVVLALALALLLAR